MRVSPISIKEPVIEKKGGKERKEEKRTQVENETQHYSRKKAQRGGKGVIGVDV